MRGGTLMILAGAMFFIAGGLQAAVNNAGSGGAFIAIGAVFVVIGAKKRKAERGDAR